MSKDLRTAAAELALGCADRLMGKLDREMARIQAAGGRELEIPRAGIAWSTLQVLADPDGAGERWIQVCLYFGRHAPRPPDPPAEPPPQRVNDLPHYPMQGDLLL